MAWAVPIEVKRTILPKLTLRVTETSLPGQATPPCPTVPLPSSSLEVPVGFIKGGGTPYTGLCLLPVSLSLEVSVGKATTIYAVNGTEILLPCTFSSCFGFYDLHFWWTYNNSDTSRTVRSRGGRAQLRPSPLPCCSLLPLSQTLVPSGLTPLWGAGPRNPPFSFSRGNLSRVCLEGSKREGCLNRGARIWSLLEFLVSILCMV